MRNNQFFAPAFASIALSLAFSVAFADGLSKACTEEFANLSEKSGFDMQKFIKELPVAVAKTKAQAKIPKTPFNSGPDPDNKITNIGITVGCLKAFPESPAAIKSSLMDVGMEMSKGIVASKLGIAKDEIPGDISQLQGFVLKKSMENAAEALGLEPDEVPADAKGLESLLRSQIKKNALQGRSLRSAENILGALSLANALDFSGSGNNMDVSIPANVGADGGSGGSMAKPVISIGLAAAGLGAVIYGIVQNGNVSSAVGRRDGKAAVDAESNRNIGYGVGAGLLASGLTVYIAF
jgi:hypothetical protein